MSHRFDVLCVATIVSWLGGVVAIAPSVLWAPIILTGLIGVAAAPLIGIGRIKGLADLSEWENFGPRDFYCPRWSSPRRSVSSCR